MGREDHSRARLAHVPDPDCAVAGGGGKDIGVARVPNGRVNAIGMLLESTDTCGSIEGPELDAVVPRRRQKGVTADGVEVEGVDFAGVFLEGANRIGGGREGEVVELDRAVSDGGDEERFVRLGPGDIVDTVGSVEGGEFGDRSGGGEFEDMETAVAEDPKVLGGGDGETGLVEGAELHGIAIEWGFEDWHFLGFFGVWENWDLLIRFPSLLGLSSGYL